MISQKSSSLPAPTMSLSLLALVHERPLRLQAESPLMLFSLSTAACKLTVGGRRHILDRANWFVLPARARALASIELASTRLLALEVHAPLHDQVVGTYHSVGLCSQRLTDFLTQPQLLPRTVWVHEVCHRYLFERYTCGAANNIATAFLETELVKEFYYLCRDREGSVERTAALQKHSPLVERALAVIETDLASPLAVDALARRCRVSASTLLRAFKRELKCSPGAYARAHRLDEALAMLRAGCFSITEVASRVGYENPTSFSHAFQLRFGDLPSAFLRRLPRRKR